LIDIQPLLSLGTAVASLFGMAAQRAFEAILGNVEKVQRFA
jgi:hypothetical protein